MGMGTLFFIIGALLKEFPPPKSLAAGASPPPSSKAMAAMLYLYVCFYSMGWGPLPCVPSYLLPRFGHADRASQMGVRRRHLPDADAALRARNRECVPVAVQYVPFVYQHRRTLSRVRPPSRSSTREVRICNAYKGGARWARGWLGTRSANRVPARFPHLDFVVAKVTPTLEADLGYKLFLMFATINIGGMAVFSL